MTAIYEWVRGIVSYLIFITVLLQLLPSSRYEKYLRLFAGCILILLVLEPVTTGLRLQEKLDAVFRAVSFENEAGELRSQLDAMEEKKVAYLMDGYEEAAGEELAKLAAGHGLSAEKVKVSMNRDGGSQEFGKIQAVSMTVRAEETSQEANLSGDGSQGASAEKNGAGKAGIETVQVDRIQTVEIGEEGEAAEEAGAQAAGPGERQWELEGNPNGQSEGSGTKEQETEQGESGEAAVAALRQEIAGYYQVEEAYVEIEVEP